MPLKIHRRSGKEAVHDWNRFFYHISRNLSNSVYRIFEPEWKPQILQWFACKDITPAQKEALLYSLTHFEDACGGFFQYHAYFLAAEALAYFKESAQADTIIRQLLLWSYAYFRQDKRDWRTYPIAMTRAARKALERTDRDRIIAQFEQLLHTTDSRLVLRVAAERLGELDPGNACAIAALACLTQVPQPPGQLLTAARSLMKVAPKHPAIIPALLQVIQIPVEGKQFEQWDRLHKAFFCLQTVAMGDPTTIAVLLEQLRNWRSQDAYMFQILQTLEKIAKGHSEVIEVLKQIIQFILTQTTPSNWENLILQCCLETLESIAVEDSEVLPFLSQLLHEQQDLKRQSLIAATVVWLEPHNKDAIAILTHFLETELCENEKWYSQTLNLVMKGAVSLLRAAPNHAIALDALFYVGQTCLMSYDFSPPRELLKLQEIDSHHQIESEILLRLIESGKPESHLYQMIQRFAQLNKGDERSVTALVQLAQSTQVDNLVAIANYCDSRVLHHPYFITTVTPKLLQTIHMTENEHERELAAYCLGKLMPHHPLAARTLIQSWERSGSETPILRLMQLDMLQEPTLNALIQFLQTQQPSVQLLHHIQKIESTRIRTALVQRLKHTLEAKPKGSVAMSEPWNAQLQKPSPVEDRLGYPPVDQVDICHQIIWDCSQNMSYPEFCKAWLTLM